MEKVKEEKLILDEVAWNILIELQRNARIAFKQLAETVNLSQTATIERVKKMEEAGIITGYSANIDTVKAGYALTALLAFSTNYGDPREVVNEIIKEVPEIISSWSVTGSNDRIFEVKITTLEFLQDILTVLTKHGKVVTSIVLPGSIKKQILKPPRNRM